MTARSRLARKIAGLLDPEMLARYHRGAFALPRVDPFPVEDVDGTDRLSATVSEMPGVDLNIDAQLSRLASWAERGPAVFDEIRSDPAVNTRGGPGGPIDNGYYLTPDAEVYFGLILDLAPSRIVEVGGGFSTLVARHACDRLGGDTSLVVIDPQPRTSVRSAASELMLQRVETVDSALLGLGPGDILFIDSSHVVRTGGDLPHLMLEIVPRLAPGTVVHVHDIFLPYGYASQFSERFWTEQYLLHALLSGSDRYQVTFATHLMTRQHLDAMRDAIGPAVATRPDLYGQSFWFTVR